MVIWAAALGSAGALPFAARMGTRGIASLGALSAEAEQAAAGIARSFMNRLGRLPTVKELFDALGPITHTPSQEKPYSPEQPAAQDQIPERWPVTGAQRTLGEAYDALKSVGGRSFQSYVKKQLELERYYAGLTGGTRTPRENVQKRDASNYPSENYEPAKLDRTSNSYSSIRGREQQLIEYYRSRGISDNRINGIGPRNRLRNYYMKNAESEFGPTITPTDDE